MLADTPKTVTVKAAWMKACGYAEIDTQCDVVRLAAVSPSGDRFFDVILPNGRHWTVASYRLI